MDHFSMEIRRRLRWRYVPTWVNYFFDTGLALGRMFRRYPLADQAGSLSCQPLFIVSSGRAGTTLLRSMLAVGGQIAIPPESYVIPTAVRRFLFLQHLGWEDLCRLIVALFESSGDFSLWGINLYPAYEIVINLPKPERSLARIIDEVFKCYADQQFPNSILWGDQSPGNTLHLPRVFHTFPQARYLHLLRDGRDVVASMIEKGHSLHESTMRWETSVKQAQSLQAKLGPEQFPEVRYENLVSEPARTIGQICTFVGIEYQAEMLDFWQSPTTIEHKHYKHHRNLGQPVFASSVGKWEERLSPSEKEFVLAKTSSLLQSLGYLDR